MKILVMSDSHAAMRFMRQAIKVLKPDTVIHLGDFYDDARTLAEENPRMVFHMVPGNCDQFRVPPSEPKVLCYPVGGVRLYMTHGHMHGVKSGTYRLLMEGRQAGAKAVLYGHTHCADCHQEKDGIWVLNPGTCGRGDGSVGMIETKDGEITDCRLIRQMELEEMK